MSDLVVADYLDHLVPHEMRDLQLNPAILAVTVLDLRVRIEEDGPLPASCLVLPLAVAAAELFQRRAKGDVNYWAECQGPWDVSLGAFLTSLHECLCRQRKCISTAFHQGSPLVALHSLIFRDICARMDASADAPGRGERAVALLDKGLLAQLNALLS